MDKVEIPYFKHLWSFKVLFFGGIDFFGWRNKTLRSWAVSCSVHIKWHQLVWPQCFIKASDLWQRKHDWFQCRKMKHTENMAEIRRSPVEVGSLSHYLQGFIHPRWCRISSINSSWLLGIYLIFSTKNSSCCIPFWQTLGRHVAPHDQSCHISHLYPLATCGKIKLRILAINLGCKLMSSTFIPSTDCSVVKIFSSSQGRNKNKKMSPLCTWWSCGEH